MRAGSSAGRFHPAQSQLRRFHNLVGGHVSYRDSYSYAAAQAKVGWAYQNPSEWTRKAILNTARVGKFSSDRTILEYAEKVWKLPQVAVP